eukprot:3673638-Lingulodinium_polyedra.AAC.1
MLRGRRSLTVFGCFLGAACAVCLAVAWLLLGCCLGAAWALLGCPCAMCVDAAWTLFGCCLDA